MYFQARQQGKCPGNVDLLRPENHAMERLPMTYVGGATKHDSPVLHAAIALGEQIRAASDEIEAGRRVPPSIAAAMKEAGVFGMVMPRAWGGPELDPLADPRDRGARHGRRFGWLVRDDRLR